MAILFYIPTPPPDPLKIYSTDGYLAPIGAEGLWATARNTPGTLTVIIDTAGGSSPTARTFSSNYYVYRSFLYFDLSALPGGATVTSAVVTVRGFNDASSQVCIQQGTQTGTDNSGLVIGDWNAFTGTPFAIFDWITGNDPRNELTFNAAGITYVESVAGSVAKFCLREYDKDYSDVAPLGNDKNSMYFSAGMESNQPYITIGYTI